MGEECKCDRDYSFLESYRRLKKDAKDLLARALKETDHTGLIDCLCDIWSRLANHEISVETIEQEKNKD